MGRLSDMLSRHAPQPRNGLASVVAILEFEHQHLRRFVETNTITDDTRLIYMGRLYQIEKDITLLRHLMMMGN